MEIRKATHKDLDIILSVFDNARKYMRMNGNMLQWQNGYPQKEIVLSDISKEICHLCVEGDEILGVFTLFDGPDPTYAEIHNGKWLNNKPYGVIHRIAVNSNRSGVASYCISYCESIYDELRIDTHEDNVPMRSFLNKHGFIQCGIVIIENGEERIAFQKSKKA